MSTRTKTSSRALAVLKLPEYQVPLQITYARSVVRAMTNNPFFPSPVPPLATVEAAIEALAVAETARLTRTDGTVALRDEKRLALKILLEQLCTYVQATADADVERGPAVIESAGMAVKKKAGPPAREFAAKPGRVSGSIELVAPKAGDRAAYEWAHSIDERTTWVLLPVTVQAKTIVDGLQPGSTVFFRYRTATKDGPSDWSDPIRIIVR